MVRSTIDGVFFDESTNQAVRESVPELGVRFFELVTHLGDGATLVGIAMLMYWFGAASRRRDRVLVIAVGLAGLAIVAGIKGIVAAERPSQAELAFAPEAYGGYSFPSAHALGSAVVYTMLAAIGTVGTRRQRYAAAGVIITLVALSRVVIGVHFLGDVIVGVAIGLAFVAIVLRDPDPTPGTLFVLAGAVAILARLLGSTEYVTLAIGASLGATLAWTYAANNPANPRGASILVLGIVVLPVLALVRLSQPVVEGVFTYHWVLEIAGYAIVTGAAILVPNAAERIDDWPIVDRLQTILPFKGRVVDPKQLSPVDD